MTSQNGSRQRPSYADEREIDAFVQALRRYERGELDAEAWRAYRVARGAYSQRQEGVHMLRVKLPQGAVSSEQLRVLADVAVRYARGRVHITTRQNVQLTDVLPQDLEGALKALAAAGLTTSGAGGNAVRNVVACPYAGVAPAELFDVTPYADAFTRHFLRHRLGDSLPRKLKVAFEGCGEDHVAAAIQDLGFRARLRNEGSRVVRGFFVTAAGGTATVCTVGQPLVEFLPAADVLALGEALVRVFHARGDRVNRQRARLKHLVRAIGWETFQSLVLGELERVRAEGIPPLPFDPERPVEEGPPHRRAYSTVRLGRYGRTASDGFVRTNVHPQRQVGFVTVAVSLGLGEATAAQLRALAALAGRHGDGGVRLTRAGDVLLRWVRDEEVAELYAGLADGNLNQDGAGSAAAVVACPGGETCRLAVTRTRGVARAVEDAVRAQLGPAALRSRLPVHVSGCPNGCSQHHVAAIGLQGGARKLGRRAVPQYRVLLGGFLTPTGAVFGRVAARIPARRVPEAITRLTTLYLAERAEAEEAGPFFARAFEEARELLAPLEPLRLEDASHDDFVEPGSSEEFRPVTTEGEVAA